jgi:hypothetical protein
MKTKGFVGLGTISGFFAGGGFGAVEFAAFMSLASWVVVSFTSFSSLFFSLWTFLVSLAFFFLVFFAFFLSWYYIIREILTGDQIATFLSVSPSRLIVN